MGYVNCQTYTISSCFADECQINVKLTRYLGVGVTIFLFSIIRHPRLPPILHCFPKGGGYSREDCIYISMIMSSLPVKCHT